MELKTIEESDQHMLVEISGESHTFCNLMRKTLHQDKHVKSASYSIEHPLLSEPKLYVKVASGSRPKEVLRNAAKRIADECKDLQTQLLKFLKK